MSDSDSSDYVVEDYVIPDAVRNTYNNEDLLSDSGGGSDSDDSGKGGESEVEDSSIKNRQCKLKNGSGSAEKSVTVTENSGTGSAEKSAEMNGDGSTSKPHEDPEDDSGPEPARANSRYILYVTNLSGETTKSMLEDFFGDAGAIRAIRIPKVRLGCYAFVEMKDFDGFKKGLKFNNKELDGRKIQVYEGSKNKKHTSTKSKNLKRKTQRQILSNIKLKKSKDE